MDILSKFKTITLQGSIELFAPIFVLVHHWNVGEKYSDVFASKKKFIEDTLIQEVKFERIRGVIRNKLVCNDDGYHIADYDGDDAYELDYETTQFDLAEVTNLLFKAMRKNGSPVLRLMVNQVESDSRTFKDEDVSEEDGIGTDICSSVEAMPVSTLKKKVKELSNEKVKWDKSLVIAAKVGLLFYEKGLSRPATEKAFKAEYAKEFAGIPNKTVSLIYKSLPAEYRNLGEKPPKETNDLDPVIKAAVLAGAQSGERDSMNAKSLRKSLSMEGYEVPSYGVLEKIIAAVMTLEVDEYE